MDAVAQTLLAYLASRGDFAVIAGVEAWVIWQLYSAYIRSLHDRVTESRAAEDRMVRALNERTQELEKMRELLARRRGSR